MPDEALRPDGGHDHARRDRTHRDLEENRQVQTYRPRAALGEVQGRLRRGCQMLTEGLVYESVVDFAADSPRRGLLNPPRSARRSNLSPPGCVVAKCRG